MEPETIDREQAIQRRQKPFTPRAHAATLGNVIDTGDGYRRHPPSIRPHCDMCGPFAHPDMRQVEPAVYRCRSCDEE